MQFLTWIASRIIILSHSFGSYQTETFFCAEAPKSIRLSVTLSYSFTRSSSPVLLVEWNDIRRYWATPVKNTYNNRACQTYQYTISFCDEWNVKVVKYVKVRKILICIRLKTCYTSTFSNTLGDYIICFTAINGFISIGKSKKKKSCFSEDK